MRKGVVETLALAVVLTMVCLGQGQPAADKPKPKADGKDKETPKKSKLEEMLEQALANNPDIRVAEAKVREVEAKLSKTRLEVTQKVATLYAAIELAQQTVEAAEAGVQRAKALLERGNASMEEFTKARAQLALAKAELAKLQADAAYLLGKMSGEKSANTDKAVERGLHYLHWLQTKRDQDYASTALALLALEDARIQKAAGPMNDRIRKALDKPVTLNYRGKSSESILKDLFKKSNVPLHIAVKLDDTMTLESSEELPLGAALQMFQDFSRGGIRFVVRDYGVLVTDVKQLPDGAVLLHDFWKSKERGELLPDKPKDGKNPPAENVEGVVTAMTDSGLIKISIGSGGPLKRGHTLEVYRLKDKMSKYLGTVRVLEVVESAAVATPVGKLSGPVEVGDRVASRILGK